jgi:rsbT co-antagonist protein RsbR
VLNSHNYRLPDNVMIFVTVTTKEAGTMPAAQLEARIEELELIQTLTRQLYTARDEESLADVLFGLAQNMGVTGLTLVYIDNDLTGYPEWATIVAWRDVRELPSMLGTRFFLPEFPFTKIWSPHPGMPTLIPNMPHDTTVDEMTRQAAAQAQTAAMVFVPLCQNDHWLGLVTFNWSEPHEFSEAEERIFSVLPAVITPVVASRRLMRELEMRVETATNALRSSERRYRQILDAIPDFVLVKSEKSRIVWANKAFREYYAMSEDELNGVIDAPFNEPDYTQQYIQDDAFVFNNGQVLNIPEETVTRHDGEARLFNTIKSPIYNEAGQVIMTLGVSRDITERKEADAERERLHQQVIDVQRRLVLELSTPLIPLLDGILIMPLIGSIDTARARDIMRTMLKGIGDHRAKILILDITGVPLVDSGVAAHLNKAILAARLKGVGTIITGISDAVAETIVDMGIDWSSVETQRDLQGGLMSALNRQGMSLVQRGAK